MEEIASIIFDIRIWATIVLGILVNGLVRHTPRLIRGYWKGRRLRKLIKIRKARVNQAEVLYEISKANSYFIFFLLMCLMYLILITMGPLGEIADESKLTLSVLVIPLYAVEFLWLFQDEYAKRLVKASRCIAKC